MEVKALPQNENLLEVVENIQAKVQAEIEGLAEGGIIVYLTFLPVGPLLLTYC